jgi:putative addiction module antidote
MATLSTSRPVPTAKITTIGNSVGIVLPKETLGRLKVAKGDLLYITDTPDGIQLTPYEPNFANKMAILEDVMRENRDVLHLLAK